MKKFISLLMTIYAITVFAQDKDVVGANIDKTVKPGDDFFKYANGNWINHNPIPGAYSRWSMANLVQEDVWLKLKVINEMALKDPGETNSNTRKIHDFYLTAMDSFSIEKAKLTPLAQDLSMINSIKDIAGLLKAFAYFHSIGVPVAFDLDVEQDMKNSDVMALYLSQGGLGLPDRDYYFNKDARTMRIVKDYKTKHLPATLEFINAKFITGGTAVYDLEKDLATKSRKLEDLRDPYANYNKMSLSQLAKLTPNINWTTIFGQLNIKTDSVIVGQPEFFTQLNKLVNSVPLGVWKNYLRYQLITEYAGYLNKKVNMEDFRFYGKVIRGRKEQLPRWKRSLQWEESAMGEVLGQLYVKDNFSPEAKARYEKLCDDVFAAFAERIKELDWMTEATKQKALQKLSSVTKKVGYPDKWKDFSALATNDRSLADNIKSSERFWFNYKINKLNKPVDRSEWDMTPQTWNAYYNPSNNEIVLPAAAFAIPGFKDAEIDDAVIYGYAAASTIGHEITHGFDDEGRQFDEKGNLQDWWQKEDIEKFNAKTESYVDQFNKYVVLDSLHVNGKATLGENIADLGGLAIGLDAFKKTQQYKEGKTIDGLTPLQRYFLGYALSWLGHQRDEDLAARILTDVHSPDFLRVNGPFSNIDDFYKVFDVKPGDKLYRSEPARVKIW
ncbi:MAG: putative metalloendopeptidase [Bacteroidota bacterium]|nr:putative metalloendopeptidase [Bacteroidota bacterium]